MRMPDDPVADCRGGEFRVGDEFLPLVYTELRRLASRAMANEKPGQTLNATALVHEAYVRLTADPSRRFENRRHFFAAAAESMRRILVENARRKQRHKRGGGRQRVALSDELAASADADVEILAVHEALDDLARQDPVSAELVKLHFFAGCTIEEAAEHLELSPRTAYRNWSFARAWLFRHLGGAPG